MAPGKLHQEARRRKHDNHPMLTMPTRALCPERGQKKSRYVPALETDIRKTFTKYRRLQALQEKK